MAYTELMFLKRRIITGSIQSAASIARWNINGQASACPFWLAPQLHRLGVEDSNLGIQIQSLLSYH